MTHFKHSHWLLSDVAESLTHLPLTGCHSAMIALLKCFAGLEGRSLEGRMLQLQSQILSACQH